MILVDWHRKQPARLVCQLGLCVSWYSICEFASIEYKATTAAQSLLEDELVTTHDSCLPPGGLLFTTDTRN